MIDNFYQREFIIRYLFDELPNDEASEFEDQYFADDALFEEMNVVENELVDDYVQNRLSPGQKEKFETVFMISAPRRRKVEISTELFKAAEKAASSLSIAAEAQGKSNLAQNVSLKTRPKSWRDTLATFFQTKNLLPQLAMIAAALLILLGGGWFIWHFSNAGEILVAQNPAPTNSNNVSNVNSAIATPSINPVPTAPPPSPQNSPVVKPSVAPKNTAPQPTLEIKVSPKPQPTAGAQNSIVAILALAAGGVRSSDGGNLPTLKLSPETTLVRLDLETVDSDFEKYTAVVKTVNGREINRFPAFFKNGKASAQIPSQLFTTGDYTVSLIGQRKSGASETIEDYAFSVVKK